MAKMGKVRTYEVKFRVEVDERYQEGLDGEGVVDRTAELFDDEWDGAVTMLSEGFECKLVAEVDEPYEEDEPREIRLEQLKATVLDTLSSMAIAGIDVDVYRPSLGDALVDAAIVKTEYAPEGHPLCVVPRFALDQCDVWWDASWKNDSCACLMVLLGGVVYKLWCDYPEEDHRESGVGAPRYELIETRYDADSPDRISEHERWSCETPIELVREVLRRKKLWTSL